MIYPDWTLAREDLPTEDDYSVGWIFMFNLPHANHPLVNRNTIETFEEMLESPENYSVYWAKIPRGFTPSHIIATPKECREAVTGDDSDPWKDPTYTNRDWVPHISDWSYW